MILEARKSISGGLMLDPASGSYVAMRRRISEEDILGAAEDIITRRFARLGTICSYRDVEPFLRTKLANQQRELFGCIFLDEHKRVIAWEALFIGSVASCRIHPREVVKRALHLNSTSVVLAHQHPSGDPEPSDEDVQVTRRLKHALSLIEVEVLDHVIVGGMRTVSLARRGLL